MLYDACQIHVRLHIDRYYMLRPNKRTKRHECFHPRDIHNSQYKSCDATAMEKMKENAKEK